MIDDASLFHGTYNPQKARDYYLRTRKLKGRKPGSAVKSSSKEGGRPVATGTPQFSQANRSNTKSRRAELEAQKIALTKRLDRLREVLQKLVDEAKGRSGVKQPEGKDADKAPETPADKADRNADQKSKKLTGSQKATKAKKAKEAYEKEHPNTLSTDVDILQEQVKDIQAKILTAISDAKDRRSKAGFKTEKLVRPIVKKNSNDGPRGR